MPRADLPRIWAVADARYIDPAELARRLASVPFRLLGEMHDDAAHHALRAALITAIGAEGKHPAVVFEQFDLPNEAALAAATRTGADAEGVARAGNLDRAAWQWPLHRPLLEAALAAGMPIHAGNAPRAMLAPVAQSGDTAGIGTEITDRLTAASWTSAQERVLQDDIRESHCNKLPEALVPRLALAQRVRDAAMAEALVRHATADGAILIAGNGHVRRDLAVPVYLGVPARDIATVGLIEVSTEEARAPEFPRNVVAGQSGLDYVWLTTRVQREDPCAAFR